MLLHVNEKFGKIGAILLSKWLRGDAKKGDAQKITEIWDRIGLNPKKACPASNFKLYELINFFIFLFKFSVTIDIRRLSSQDYKNVVNTFVETI